MASYQPTIIPAKQTGLQKGFDAASNMFNDYIRTMLAQKMKDVYEKKQQDYRSGEVQKLINDPRFQKGYKRKVSYGNDGLEFSAEEIPPTPPKFNFMPMKPQKPTPAIKLPEPQPMIPLPQKKPLDMLKETAAGVAHPEVIDTVGQRLGVPHEQIPGMTLLSGETGMIRNADEDYGKAVQKAIYDNQMTRHLAGIPDPKQAKPAKPEVTEEFKTDLKSAIEVSNDDETVFTEKLKELSRKYSDNPAVLKHIKELMAVNKPAKAERNLFKKVK